MNNGAWMPPTETLYKCMDERAAAFETEYGGCSLEIIKNRAIADDDVVLICVVKDDLVRIKEFIKHYRWQGITRFAFVDNGSTDGTREFLLAQADCDVYGCELTYSSLRRVVWLNKLIERYGSKRWYVMVDSDEFIFYPGMEKISLLELISYSERNDISRISGYLVDMYANDKLFGLNMGESFRKKACYFDGTGYDIHNTGHGVSIMGGPRRRMFRLNNELAKCPIFKLGEEDIVASAHFLLPRIKARQNPLWLAIGHYKFLDSSDMEKINAAVKNENYAGGSHDYKLYQKGMQSEAVKTFYDKDISVELTDSSVLKRLPFLDFHVGDFYGQ